MLVKIKNLEIDCNIGVYNWEKNFIRKLIINIEVGVDDESSSYSDEIKETIDYEIIYNNIKKIIAKKKYNLIETLARDILEMLLIQDKVNFARVEIDKIKIFEDVYSCAVVLEKTT